MRLPNNINETDFFMSKVSPEPNTGCWLWIGCYTPQGYGHYKFKKAKALAHRRSYEMFRGPIGELMVLHRCDNPSCVNPEHLFLGTQSDNMNDMWNKERHPRHFKHKKKRAGSWNKGLRLKEQGAQ